MFDVREIAIQIASAEIDNDEHGAVGYHESNDGWFDCRNRARNLAVAVAIKVCDELVETGVLVPAAWAPQ